MTDTALPRRPDQEDSQPSALSGPGRQALPKSRRAPVVVTAALLVALAAVVVDTLRAGDNETNPGRVLAGYAVAWALFAAAAWTVRKVPARAATVLVLAGSVAVAVAALATPPRTSNDMFRYVWDGRVQAAGISPYTHPPAAPQLAPPA
ncbi:hypothetical protein [Streptomyces sioyaensis]|uniref:hypothetical protein n=1 Tax=Streptomyces sioyaensis TaxID=67364 RepID=UPI0037959356